VADETSHSVISGDPLIEAPSLSAELTIIVMPDEFEQPTHLAS
jgi:hypothetical protein